jgi:hypothetical protein
MHDESSAKNLPCLLNLTDKVSTKWLVRRGAGTRRRRTRSDVARAARRFRGTFDEEFAHVSARAVKSHPRNG